MSKAEESVTYEVLARKKVDGKPVGVVVLQVTGVEVSRASIPVMPVKPVNQVKQDAPLRKQRR